MFINLFYYKAITNIHIKLTDTHFLYKNRSQIKKALTFKPFSIPLLLLHLIILVKHHIIFYSVLQIQRNIIKN